MDGDELTEELLKGLRPDAKKLPKALEDRLPHAVPSPVELLAKFRLGSPPPVLPAAQPQFPRWPAPPTRSVRTAPPRALEPCASPPPRSHSVELADAAPKEESLELSGHWPEMRRELEEIVADGGGGDDSGSVPSPQNEKLQRRERKIRGNITRLLTSEVSGEMSPSSSPQPLQSTFASDADESAGADAPTADQDLAATADVISSPATPRRRMITRRRSEKTSPDSQRKMIVKTFSEPQRSAMEKPTSESPRRLMDRAPSEPQRKSNRKVARQLSESGQLHQLSQMEAEVRLSPSEPTRRHSTNQVEVFDADLIMEGGGPHHMQRREAMAVPSSTSVEHRSREVPLQFSVVRWSSQRPEHPAAELCKSTGRWETAPLHVRHEFVVLELANHRPCNVTSLSLTMPGSDAAPRHCRVHYARESADGPWREAWRFDVRSNDEPSHYTSHDYGRSAKDLQTLLQRHFGGIDEAWEEVFLVPRDVRLSYADFASGMHRLRQLPDLDRSGCGCFEDIQRLFEVLDLTWVGSVGLEDLRRPRINENDIIIGPEAVWWRLGIFSNWGSNSGVAIAAPLTLYTTNKTDCDYVDQLRAIRRKSERHRSDFTSAFKLEELGLTGETMHLRDLAHKHGLPISVVEDIHDQFRQVDADDSGHIERGEFEGLILRLHGAKDESDLPKGRMRFFWRQANADGNSHIDFEEFLLWFRRYFSADNVSAGSHISADVIVRNFYASMCTLGSSRLLQRPEPETPRRHHSATR